MHVSQGTETTNPHSYPKSALKDKATTQLHGWGLRRYSRFQFPDWSMQNFPNNVLLAYFLWNLLKGENTHCFSVECKYEMTVYQHMKPNLCEHLLVESFTLRNRPQQYALGQRRRRELNFFCPWLQIENQGAPTAYATLETWPALVTVPCLSLRSPTSQSVATELVGRSPHKRSSPTAHSNRALLTQPKHPAGPTPWGRRFTYPQKPSLRQEKGILPSERREETGEQVLSDLAKHLLFMEISIQITYSFP